MLKGQTVPATSSSRIAPPAGPWRGGRGALANRRGCRRPGENEVEALQRRYFGEDARIASWDRVGGDARRFLRRRRRSRRMNRTRLQPLGLGMPNSSCRQSCLQPPVRPIGQWSNAARIHQRVVGRRWLPHQNGFSRWSARVSLTAEAIAAAAAIAARAGPRKECRPVTAVLRERCEAVMSAPICFALGNLCRCAQLRSR